MLARSQSRVSNLLVEGPVTVHGLVLDASFECGSAGAANLKLDAELDVPVICIDVLPECHGTPHAKTLGTWWYFSVANVEKDEVLHFEVSGMTNQRALMNADHRPVYSHSEKGPFQRVRYPCTFTAVPGKPGFTLGFRHKVELHKEPTYFAFTYPYTITQTNTFIEDIERRVGNRADDECLVPVPSFLSIATRASAQTAGRGSTARSKSCVRTATKPTSNGSAKASKQWIDPTQFFFSREVLTYSYDGNPIELLTITSWDGLDPTETPTKREPTLPSLFPHTDSTADTTVSPPYEGSPTVSPPPEEAVALPCSVDDFELTHVAAGIAGVSLGDSRRLSMSSSESDSAFGEESGILTGFEEPPRSHVMSVGKWRLRPPSALFHRKKVVLISSRVHPGETPASYALKGMLSLLCNQTDERAQELRKRFVFIVIPHLNPDGVLRGHWRMDHRGINLNRCYIDPKLEDEPSVYALKTIFMHYHSRNLLYMYIDSHAHAGQRGCFLFGNNIPDPDKHVLNLMYPRFVALHTPHLDISACNFSEENMAHTDGDEGTTRESSARVALYKESNLLHCYTLECNYNTGNVVNAIPPATNDGGRATPPPSSRLGGGAPGIPPKYSPEVWLGVGRACMIGILDLCAANPWSRLARSEYRCWDGVRKAVTFQLALESRRKPAKAGLLRVPSVRATAGTRLSAKAVPDTSRSTSGVKPVSSRSGIAVTKR